MFKAPTKGQQVKVTTRWRNYSILATSPTSDMITIGEVIGSEQWDLPGTFRILAGDPRHAVAVIPLEKVVAIEDESGKSLEQLPDTVVSRSWEVAGSKGGVYNVLQVGSKWSCSCVAFQYRKHCKHIAAKIEELSCQSKQ
jgi:hypothetical protein